MSDFFPHAQLDIERLDALLRRALVFNHVFDAIVVTAPDGTIKDWNSGAERIFGWTRDEALGQTPALLHRAADVPALWPTMQSAVVRTGRWSGPMTCVRKDGSESDCSATALPLLDHAHNVWGTLLVLSEGDAGSPAESPAATGDIMGMKRAAEELEEAQARLVYHVENSPFAVIEWDPQFRITRWAGQAEKMFGWTAAEVVGRHFRDFPFVHPDDLAKVNIVGARLVDGLDQRSASHNRNLAKNGRTVHCSWQNSVLHDSRGQSVSILSLVQDVTERVVAEQAGRKTAAEQQALERKLQEAQKLESLGVLAGGIAHDFNNLLTGVFGNASLARLDLPADSPVQPLLEQIEVAAMRAADLCKQMLAYSGKGRFVVQRLALNALIEDITRLLQVSISKRSVLKFSLAEALPPVLGDATQLRQVVMNLVINASEAIGEKSGFISITTGLTRADRAYLAGTFFAPDLPEGDYLFLEVADNGGGMPPEVQARIFDPFFTTKFTGRGLGLAAVLGIIRGHKGALKVFSEPGWGTTFKILFPCAEGPADQPAETAPAPAGWRGAGTVLVVDDEETVRVTTARMLESLGFATRLAEHGRTGVEEFRAAPDSFALVVLDLTMPHMDGEEAFREITALRPGARVLLMSGFNEQEALAQFTGKGLAGFLQKPFNLPALREKLQQIFSPPAAG